MCGRYGLVNPGRITERTYEKFGIYLPEFRARYNVAPSQINPVLASDAEGRPRAAMMRWGLVPFWEKSDKPKFAPINARSEEVF